MKMTLSDSFVLYRLLLFFAGLSTPRKAFNTPESIQRVIAMNSPQVNSSVVNIPARRIMTPTAPTNLTKASFSLVFINTPCFLLVVHPIKVWQSRADLIPVKPKSILRSFDG